jgi:flagellar biosynthetic protein FliQ
MDPGGRVDLGGRGGGDLTMESAPIDLVQSALVTALVVATPILLVALVVGLITALLQAATQVQDQAVSAVPKLLACGLALVVLAGWMVSKLVTFAQAMFSGGVY